MRYRGIIITAQGGRRWTHIQSLRKVYDLFMDNIPYEEWGAYLKGLLHENGVDDGLVLELGCGTGTMTEILAEAGYDMIGVDQSEEMLEEAARKREESGHEILYLCQDMREFELYGTVRAIVCVCDSMNYILEEEEVLGILTSAARNYLDYGGLFIFDLNTEYKYKEILGEQTIAENREESSFIWENYYDEDSHINEYNLTLFIKEHGDHYRKYEETPLSEIIFIRYHSEACGNVRTGITSISMMHLPMKNQKLIPSVCMWYCEDPDSQSKGTEEARYRQ